MLGIWAKSSPNMEEPLLPTELRRRILSPFASVLAGLFPSSGPRDRISPLNWSSSPPNAVGFPIGSSVFPEKVANIPLDEGVFPLDSGEVSIFPVDSWIDRVSVQKKNMFRYRIKTRFLVLKNNKFYHVLDWENKFPLDFRLVIKFVITVVTKSISTT